MKLTWWFGPNVKPARPGVYQVRVADWVMVWYAVWDGKRWGCAASTAERAIRRPDWGMALQDKFWRGLAEDPARCDATQNAEKSRVYTGKNGALR